MNGNLWTSGYRFILCAAIATLAGCAPQSSLWTNPPTGAASSVGQATSSTLLYVSDLGTNLVDVYTYPAGKLVTKLSGFGAVSGLCSDKAGDVFVVDEAGPVQMFAHGGTSPIRKLTTSGAPYGCAVDPLSGNLAVTNLSSYENGVIAIYPKAKGSAKIYRDPSEVDTSNFCGYDDKGNLFIDGWDRSANFIFMELPKGKSTFRISKLNVSTNNPGGVQWDGKYVAVANKGTGNIYRVNPATQTIASTITLKDGTNVFGIWLAGTSTLIGPNFSGGGPVSYWHYPGGGSPYKSVNGQYEPIAATLSAAK